MATDPELKRAIEAAKLRVPIEDLVRERVPALKKSGARYWACCPFHEESTPSFSVDPRSGLWYCFGACATGGDQLHFLQRIDNLTFNPGNILGGTDVDYDAQQAKGSAFGKNNVIAERALGAGVTRVMFDRSGYKYHGRVKALADAAREGGLQF